MDKSTRPVGRSTDTHRLGRRREGEEEGVRVVDGSHVVERRTVIDKRVLFVMLSRQRDLYMTRSSTKLKGLRDLFGFSWGMGWGGVGSFFSLPSLLWWRAEYLVLPFYPMKRLRYCVGKGSSRTLWGGYEA